MSQFVLMYFIWCSTLTYDCKATHKHLQIDTCFRVLGLDSDLRHNETVIDTEVHESLIVVIKTKAC